MCTFVYIFTTYIYIYVTYIYTFMCASLQQYICVCVYVYIKYIYTYLCVCVYLIQSMCAPTRKLVGESERQ